MSIVFKGKDVIHNVAVKFSQAYLPEARKPYYLRTAHQQELDIRSVADKANIYRINTAPEIIEEGFNAAVELMYYLAADGYKIKTPLFTLTVRIPGEYDGTETRLPDGVSPTVRMQPGAQLREYIKKTVHVDFDGKVEREGFIAEALDEASGLADETVTAGRILTLRGHGLKIGAEPGKEGLAGVYFVPGKGKPVKVLDLPVNEPRTLKVLVPAGLTSGETYRISVRTQISVTGNTILKKMREIQTDFTVTAQ